MNPTIKDIAEKCGVSYTTVSRALSGHPYVKDETRERIIKIARQMGTGRMQLLEDWSCARPLP